MASKLRLSQDSLRTYKRLLGYLKYYRGWFALGTAGALVFAATQAAYGLLIKEFVDKTFLERDPRMLVWVPVFLILLFVIRGLGDFTQTYFMGQVARRIVKRMRREVFDRYMALPIHYYDRHNSSEMLSRLLYNTEQVAQAATESITVMIRETLTIIAAIALMFWFSVELTLIVVCIGPVIGMLINTVNRYLRRYSLRIQNSVVDITRVAKETIEAPKVIRVFNAQNYERAQFEQVNEFNRKSVMKLMFVRALSNPVVQVIASLGASVVLYMATKQALEKTLSQGEFFGFIVALVGIFQPLRNLVNVSGPLQQGITASDSIFTLLDEPVETESGTHTVSRVRGAVEYRDVGFQYDAAQSPALTGVSLKIQPGEVIAFVGKTGSGKTTLVGLLPRFYDVTSGTILIDGHDVRDYTMTSLREQIAMVSQDVVLFNDTIRANISFGREVSNEELERAAQAAYVLEFTSKKPDGLMTVVGDRGSLLSGGQKQRISIARALLKDAPILILDEATSALDTESERAIQTALDALMKNRTTLVIAHRLSTIEKADRIVVMQDGRIAEVGTHAELLARQGLYADLHRKQFNE